jgi:hypothetical protein
MAREKLRDELVNEYRKISIDIDEAKSKIRDLQTKLQELSPELDQLYKTITQFGWLEYLDAEHPDDKPPTGLLGANKKGESIARAAETFLISGDNEWRTLAEIFEFVAEQGILIGGKNPTSTLSAHLSNANIFESDRSRGWRILKERLESPLQQYAKKIKAK